MYGKMKNERISKQMRRWLKEWQNGWMNEEKVLVNEGMSKQIK